MTNERILNEVAAHGKAIGFDFANATADQFKTLMQSWLKQNINFYNWAGTEEGCKVVKREVIKSL